MKKDENGNLEQWTWSRSEDEEDKGLSGSEDPETKIKRLVKEVHELGNESEKISVYFQDNFDNAKALLICRSDQNKKTHCGKYQKKAYNEAQLKTSDTLAGFPSYHL